MYYYNILGWRFIMKIYLPQLKNKSNFLLVQNIFFLSLQVEKENNRFSYQSIVISSQKNVPKYYPGWNEKDLRSCYGGE